MSLQDLVEAEIRREAQKLAARHQSYHNGLYLAELRNRERLQSAPPRVVHTPPHWAENRRFNPFYVLKHSGPIARSIARKLQSGTYFPNPSIAESIPKLGGGMREVQVYEIPDAAISHFFYKRLLQKDRHRFSAFAYAYREDKNVHFAIQDIAVDLRYYSRLFIAEFDFSNFFGSIRHEYLLKQLDKTVSSSAMKRSMS